MPRWPPRRSCARPPAPPTSRTRTVASEQAFELSLAPPTRGLVIGISHEGGTTATNAALRAARDAGRSTAVITVSRRSPAGALAGIVVETEELDHGWCHTVGYLSPIVAAAAVGAHLSGRPLDASAVEGLLAAGTRDESGAERIAGRPGRRVDPPRDRLGRRPPGRPRAGPQGRGGVLAAVGVSGPGDVPARAPAGHRRHDRPRADPDRSRASRRADRAGAPGAGGGTGPRPASRRRSSRPRSTRPSIATSRPPVACVVQEAPGLPGPGRGADRQRHAAPAPDRATGTRPRARTPTRSAATIRSTSRPRTPRRADPGPRSDLADERLAHDIDHVEVPAAGSPGA